MSKIKKHDEYVSHYACVTYFKDEEMFKVKATVHVNIEEAAALLGKKEIGFVHEINEIELEFYVNNKKCRYTGLIFPYEELFGKDTFNTYYKKLQEEFEEHYMNNKVKIK